MENLVKGQVNISCLDNKKRCKLKFNNKSLNKNIIIAKTLDKPRWGGEKNRGKRGGLRSIVFAKSKSFAAYSLLQSLTITVTMAGSKPIYNAGSKCLAPTVIE